VEILKSIAGRPRVKAQVVVPRADAEVHRGLGREHSPIPDHRRHAKVTFQDGGEANRMDIVGRRNDENPLHVRSGWCRPAHNRHWFCLTSNLRVFGSRNHISFH
jgi:hypothetical protein